MGFHLFYSVARDRLLNDEQLNFTCSQLHILVNSSSMKTLCVIKLILCILSPLCIIIHILSKGQRLIVHPNAKVLYGFHLFLVILSSLSYFATYAVDVYRFFTSHSYCDVLLNTNFTFPALLFAVTCDWCQGCIFLTLGIERLIASVRHEAYEKVTSTSIAAVLIVISVSYSIFSSVLLWLPGVAWNTPTMVFTIINENNEEIMQVVEYSHIAIELLSIILFHYVCSRNKRHATARFSTGLASNYQKTENRRITLVLLPVFYLHFFIFLFYNFAFPIYNQIDNGYNNPAGFAIFAEFLAWTPLYGVLVPLIIPLVDRKRRQILKKRRVEQSKNVFVPLDVLFNQPRPKTSNK